MFADGSESDEALVAQVKELQRTDPHAKAQWIAHVDLNAAGLRDPSKHDAAFLQGFLAQLNSGVSIQGATVEMCAVLGEAIKMMQKKSPVFKQVWASFCTQQGGGRMDPAKHDEKFHAKFFEQVASQASMGMGMGPAAGASPAMGMAAASPAMGMGNGGPPQKRMREMGGMAAGGGGGGLKEQLVARVKAFQKASIDQKEVWGTYVDTYFNGLRDPNRHEASSLAEFCQNHGVPEVGNSGGAAGPAMTPPTGMGGAGLAMTPPAGMGGAGPAITPPMGMGGAVHAITPPAMSSMGIGGGKTGLGPKGAGAAGTNDAEKMGLVDRVKAYQKMSPENKENWSQFCGATRDPARHDKAKLQEFCMQVGI